MSGQTIFLVRHGETEWNVEGRLQGQLDSPLTPLGRGQARAVGRRLRGLVVGPVAIEASPRGRAQETARLIAQELGMDPATIVTDDRLAEHDFGHWAGLTHEEVEERFPGQRAARRLDQWHYTVPGGESYEVVDRRARAWLAAQRRTPITIAVTHEMTSRTIQGAYLGLDQASILAALHPQDRCYRLCDGAVEELIC